MEEETPTDAKPLPLREKSPSAPGALETRPMIAAGKRQKSHRATAEAKEFCRRIVRDRRYRLNVQKRMRNGTMGPLEGMIWHYAYGKPKEVFEVNARLAELSDDELNQLEDILLRMQKVGQ